MPIHQVDLVSNILAVSLLFHWPKDPILKQLQRGALCHVQCHAQ